MTRNILPWLISATAIIAFITGKFESGILFMILGQLIEINNKLGDK